MNAAAFGRPHASRRVELAVTGNDAQAGPRKTAEETIDRHHLRRVEPSYGWSQLAPRWSLHLVDHNLRVPGQPVLSAGFDRHPKQRRLNQRAGDRQNSDRSKVAENNLTAPRQRAGACPGRLGGRRSPDPHASRRPAGGIGCLEPGLVLGTSLTGLAFADEPGLPCAFLGKARSPCVGHPDLHWP